jgi:curved DNA-binding protein CbpA
MTDSYAELDIPRDANAATVNAAFRKKSKRAHPDAGGTAEEFDKLSKCRAVLLDPKRREDYDRTGKMEDPEPDNAQAKAMQLAVQGVMAVMAALEKQGLKPEEHDVVAMAITDLKMQISQAKKKCAEGRKEAEKASKMAKRFSSKTANQPSFIRKSIEARADEVLRAVRNDEKDIEAAETAVSLLKNETFEKESFAHHDGPRWETIMFSPIGA